MTLLKIIIRILLYITAAFFLFIALVGAFTDEGTNKWYFFIFLVVLSVILISIGNYLNNKKPKSTQLSLKNDEIKENEVNNEIINIKLPKLLINRVVTQVIESIDIISNTKNVDILESRLSLLKEVFENLKELTNHPLYRVGVIETIDNYKQIYYNKPISQLQIQAVTHPFNFKLIQFASVSLYDCFVKNYNVQMIMINSLKTEKGKKGRYKKLLENLDYTINLMLKKFMCDEAVFYKNKLEEYRSEFTKKLL